MNVYQKKNSEKFLFEISTEGRRRKAVESFLGKYFFNDDNFWGAGMTWNLDKFSINAKF